MTVRVYGITGAGAVPSGKTRVYKISGAGSTAVGTVRVYKISGTGGNAPTLTSDRSLYEAGETVTVTPINGAAPHTYVATAGGPLLGASVDPTTGVLTFTAPALLDPKLITVSYNSLYFLTITIHEASVTMGNTGIPCAVYLTFA